MDTNNAHFPPNASNPKYIGSTFELELFRSTLAALLANATVTCSHNTTGLVELALELTGTAVAKLRAAEDIARFASDEPPESWTPPLDGPQNT